MYFCRRFDTTNVYIIGRCAALPLISRGTAQPIFFDNLIIL